MGRVDLKYQWTSPSIWHVELHMLHLFPGPEVKVTELGSEDPDLAPALADLKTLDLNQEAVLLGLPGLLPSPCFPSQDGRVE